MAMDTITPNPSGVNRKGKPIRLGDAPLVDNATSPDGVVVEQLGDRTVTSPINADRVVYEQAVMTHGEDKVRNTAENFIRFRDELGQAMSFPHNVPANSQPLSGYNQAKAKAEYLRYQTRNVTQDDGDVAYVLAEMAAMHDGTAEQLQAKANELAGNFPYTGPINRDEVERLYKIHQYLNVYKGKQISKDAWFYGKMIGLSPEQLDKVMDAVIATTPEYQDFESKGAFARGREAEAYLSNITRALENGDLTTEQKFDAATDIAYLERFEERQGFWSHIPYGFGAYAQDFVEGFTTIGEQQADADREYQKYTDPDFYDSAVAPIGGSFVDPSSVTDFASGLYESYAYGINNKYARSLVNMALQDPTQDLSVIYKDMESRRVFESIATLAVDIGTLLLPLKGGTITGSIGHTVIKPVSKVGRAAVNAAGGVLDNVAIMQSLQASTSYALADVSNRYYGTNLSTTEAFFDGLTSNILQNAAMAMALNAPAEVALVYQAARATATLHDTTVAINSKVDFVNQLREQFKDLPAEKRKELINDGWKKNHPDGSNVLYVWRPDLYKVLVEAEQAGILTPEQRAFFGDIEAMRDDAKGMTIDLGDYGNLIAGTQLGERMRNIVRDSDEGMSIKDATDNAEAKAKAVEDAAQREPTQQTLNNLASSTPQDYARQQAAAAVNEARVLNGTAKIKDEPSESAAAATRTEVDANNLANEAQSTVETTPAYATIQEQIADVEQRIGRAEADVDARAKDGSLYKEIDDELAQLEANYKAQRAEITSPEYRQTLGISKNEVRRELDALNTDTNRRRAELKARRDSLVDDTKRAETEDLRAELDLLNEEIARRNAPQPREYDVIAAEALEREVITETINTRAKELQDAADEQSQRVREEHRSQINGLYEEIKEVDRLIKEREAAVPAEVDAIYNARAAELKRSFDESRKEMRTDAYRKQYNISKNQVRRDIDELNKIYADELKDLEVDKKRYIDQLKAERTLDLRNYRNQLMARKTDLITARDNQLRDIESTRRNELERYAQMVQAFGGEMLLLGDEIIPPAPSNAPIPLGTTAPAAPAPVTTVVPEQAVSAAEPTVAATATTEPDAVLNATTRRVVELDDPSVPSDQTQRSERAKHDKNAPPPLDREAEHQRSRIAAVSRSVTQRVFNAFSAAARSVGFDLGSKQTREVVATVTTMINSLANDLELPLGTFLGETNGHFTRYFPKFETLAPDRDFSRRVSKDDLVAAGNFDPNDFTIRLSDRTEPLFLYHELLHYNIQVLFDAINNPEIVKAASPAKVQKYQAVQRNILKDLGYTKQWTELTRAEKIDVHERLVNGYIDHLLEMNVHNPTMKDLNGRMLIYAGFSKAIAQSAVRVNQINGRVWVKNVERAREVESAMFKEQYGNKTTQSDSFFNLMDELALNDSRAELDHTIEQVYGSNLDFNINAQALKRNLHGHDEFDAERVQQMENLESVIADMTNSGALARAVASAENLQDATDQVNHYIKEFVDNNPDVQIKQHEAENAKLEFEKAEAKLTDKTVQADKEQRTAALRDYKKAKASYAKASTALKKAVAAAEKQGREIRKNIRTEHKGFNELLKKVRKEYAPNTRAYARWNRIDNMNRELRAQDDSAKLSVDALVEFGMPEATVNELITKGVASNTGTLSIGDFAKLYCRGKDNTAVRNMLGEMAGHISDLDQHIRAEATKRFKAIGDANKRIEAMPENLAKFTQTIVMSDLDLLYGIIRKLKASDSASKLNFDHRSLFTVVKNAVSDDIGMIAFNACTPRKLISLGAKSLKSGYALWANGDFYGAYKLLLAAETFNVRATKAGQVRKQITDRITTIRNKMHDIHGAVKDIGYDVDTMAVAESLAYAIGIIDRKSTATKIRSLRRYNPELSARLDQELQDLAVGTGADHYSRMPIGDLEHTLNTIEKIIAEAYEIEKGKRLAATALTEKTVIAVTKEVSDANKAKPKANDQPENALNAPYTRNWRERARSIVSEFYHNSSSFEGLAEFLTKTRWSKFKQVIVDPIIQAEARLLQASRGYASRINNIAKDIDAFEREYAKSGKQQTYTIHGYRYDDLGNKVKQDFEFGNVQSLRREVFGAMLHLGNDSNMLSLANKFGITIEAMHNEFVRMTELGIIDKSMWDAAQKVWDIYDELDMQAQAASLKMTGKRYTQIEARGFTAFGTKYKGGYVPLTRLEYRPAEVNIDTIATVLHESYPTSPHWMDERSKSIANDLDISAIAALRAIDGRLRYIHMLPEVLNVSKILKSPTLRNTLDRVVEDASRRADEWLMDNAYGSPVNNRAITHSVRAICMHFSNAVTGLMFANIPNAVLTATNVFPASLRIATPYMLRTLPHVWQLKKTSIEQSAFMRERMAKMGSGLDTALNRVLTPSRFRRANQWISDHAYFMQILLQRQMDEWIWHAAFEQAKAKNGAKGLELNDADAVYYADSVVRTTQGGYSLASQSVADKNHPVVQKLMPLMSYTRNQFVLAMNESRIRNAAQKNRAIKFFNYLLVGSFTCVIPAVLTQLVNNAASGVYMSDDPEVSEAGMKDLFLAPVKQMALMVNPWAGTFFNATLTTATGGQTYGAPTMPYINNAYQASTATGRVIRAMFEGNPDDIKGRDLISMFGIFSGMSPVVSLMMREGKVAVMMNDNWMDNIRGFITGRVSQEQRDAYR